MAQIDKILDEVPEIDIRFELRKDLKQALYKDMYEIISFSADRADAYKKLKEYFGE